MQIPRWHDLHRFPRIHLRYSDCRHPTPTLLDKMGTSSPHKLGIASGSFDSKTILLNAWLANTPQILLSFSYFAINRLCTSMCFAREWNRYGTARKVLRTTNPMGQQRSTYFLQLPIYPANCYFRNPALATFTIIVPRSPRNSRYKWPD